MSMWRGEKVIIAGIIAVSSLLQACPPEPEVEDEPEVATEIYVESLGEPMPSATDEQKEAFEKGLEVAARRFDTSDGLGPDFNVSFCGSCHEQPAFGGSSPRYRDFPLVADELSDGSLVMLGKSGVQTQFSILEPYRIATPEDADIIANRNAIPFFGVGALAEIDEESILENSDPDDADGDGISGRPNWDRGFVGRFGRKSQTVSLEGFIRGPMFNHAGVTSNPLPNWRKAELPVPSEAPEEEGARSLGLFPDCLNCQAAAPAEPTTDDDATPDPELGEEDLFNLVSAVMVMGAPMPDEPTEQTERGEELFEETGCADCHTPGLEGPRGLVMAYSDLLLHDMGPELADGISQGVATGSEFRTQPLWGVAATAPYLHDGRADTIDQAIRYHGGEGETSREEYEALSDTEREDLLAFLRSLGGADQASTGLLAPDEPVPAAGEWGGPSRELDESEVDLYEKGREVFDRDFALDAGLGEGFNGDSCRACHFDPVIGGSGPVGVSVTRQGIVDETGTFFTPEPGTMLHHHVTAVDQRPQADPDCNVFEIRQTPPTFGLGLIDQIPDEQILEKADPNDEDGDGISGKASQREDGRVNKFGWKAAFPSLEDFVRDALSNEVGLTVPESADHVAGNPADTPEIDADDYAALVFYTTMLGPPPGGEKADAAARGEEVFDEVNCSGCHTPEMTTEDGTVVPLYSDLLLHDVAPDDMRGIESGDASMREFRTPPLWGISMTGPYMHDGLAPTLDAAIRRHEGEAADVTAAYEALSDADREALIAFLESL